MIHERDTLDIKTFLLFGFIGLFLCCVRVTAGKDIETPVYEQKLEAMLKQITNFWLDKSIDRENGGYTISFDAKGQVRSGANKMIVSQARTLWLFSRLIRAGYGTEQMSQAAAHGYSFLTQHMWDSEQGGFYWEVDDTGRIVTRSDKHLYGQSFALYAMSEYYLATRKPEVLAFANRFFELLDTKAHDAKYGGYIESFQRDWTVDTNATSPMGTTQNQKLMNTHLHLLEALTTYYRASHSPLAKQRLQELIQIQTNTVLRKNIGACTDRYTQDWTPIFTQVSYGHDIENVWLVMDACDAIGHPNAMLKDFYETLFNYSYRYGYDQTHGGFYDTGEFNQPANSRNKIWWVQAEALVSALSMVELTGDEKYLTVFTQTLDFVDHHVMDWQVGEWHETTSPEGVPRLSNKAHAWKCGYHNGRAMIECLERLKRLK